MASPYGCGESSKKCSLHGVIEKLRGKSGGVRVIYYWVTKNEQIYMLYVFPKSKQEVLTSKQVIELRSIVERWSDEK